MVCRCAGIVTRTSSRFNLKRHFQKGHCTARWTNQATDIPPALPSEPVAESPHISESGPVEVKSSSSGRPQAAVPSLPEDADLRTRQDHLTEASRSVPHTVCTQLAAYVPSKPQDWLRFASRPEAQQVLRRFCGICGQWLACVRSAKLHYRSVHPTIYETFNMVAAADCKRVGHLVSPCSFCGAVVARIDQHLLRARSFGRLECAA